MRAGGHRGARCDFLEGAISGCEYLQSPGWEPPQESTFHGFSPPLLSGHFRGTILFRLCRAVSGSELSRPRSEWCWNREGAGSATPPFWIDAQFSQGQDNSALCEASQIGASQLRNCLGWLLKEKKKVLCIFFLITEVMWNLYACLYYA